MDFDIYLGRMNTNTIIFSKIIVLPAVQNPIWGLKRNTLRGPFLIEPNNTKDYPSKSPHFRNLKEIFFLEAF